MTPHDRNAYEKANLLNAHKLHDLITTLDEINDENKVLDACFLYQEYISDAKDLRLFYENPLAFEWEFTEKIDVKKAEWEETMNGYQRII